VVADGVLAGEHSLRDSLADDDDGLRAFGVEFVEIASLKNWNANGSEKAGRNDPPVGAWIVDALNVTITGILKAGAIVVRVPPGRGHAESRAGHAGEDVNPANRFFVEIEDLLR